MDCRAGLFWTAIVILGLQAGSRDISEDRAASAGLQQVRQHWPRIRSKQEASMTRLALAVTCLLGSAGGVLAQVRAGGEFQVNTSTTASLPPSVTSSRAGESLVTWSGFDGTAVQILAQRYDARGTRLGAEFTVNTYTLGGTYDPAAASLPGGGFIVVWSGPDEQSIGVFARRFDQDGTARGPEFRVNTYTTHFQHQPAVAASETGSFLVVWSSAIQDDGNGVFGQLYGADGEPVGGEFRVNTYTTGRQFQPAVAAQDSGAFVVVWEGYNGPPGGGIFAQRVDPSGSLLGGEIQVGSPRGYPAVATAGAGGFVVAWSGTDGSGVGVQARLFDAGGSPVGAEFLVNTETASVQSHPSVASAAAGDFVVAWHSLGQDGGGVSPYGVFAQRFSTSGERRGGEFQVNTATYSSQREPAVAADPAGNFTIVWASLFQVGNNFGVFGQRFGGLHPVGMGVDSAGGGQSDGNGLLEAGETVTVRPSWRNVNGAAQTFGAAASNLEGPAGASYTLTDTVGDYGTVANGAVAPCSDCYGVSVSAPPSRPAPHWDASFLESILPDAQGQRQIWKLHIGDSFTDVPRTSPFYRFIETLLHNGVTAGCAEGQFCPASFATRAQMAVFALAGNEGASYTPPPCSTGNETFDDVPATSGFCRWIEELSRRGIVAGCSVSPPLYCPSQPVTREQMAVFALATEEPRFTPPACVDGAELFGDVDDANPFCPWIEELARRGVVSGCVASPPLYCPGSPVGRGEMSVFICDTFGLTLYGP
jgi:hypothetical protein